MPPARSNHTGFCDRQCANSSKNTQTSHGVQSTLALGTDHKAASVPTRLAEHLNTRGDQYAGERPCGSCKQASEQPVEAAVVDTTVQHSYL